MQDIGIHFSSDDDWNEHTIKWKNQPNFDNSAEDTIKNPSRYDIIEFDVTQITEEEITGNGGNGYLTLVIKSEEKWFSNYLKLYSKENSFKINSQIREIYTVFRILAHKTDIISKRIGEDGPTIGTGRR